MPELWTGYLIGRMHNNEITLTDLAKELGVTRAYVSMILNGRRKPKGSQERMETAVQRLIENKEVQGNDVTGNCQHEEGNAVTQ